MRKGLRMRFIDEKGRLLGKINIVDFFIISLLIIVIPGFLYVYKVLEERPTWVPSKWVKVEAVTFTLPEIADIIKVGDIHYAFKKPRAKVLKILERDDKYKQAICESSMLQYEHRIPILLELDLLCTKSGEDEPYYFERNEVVVSLDRSIHTFNTPTYSIKFYILKIKDQDN